MFVPYSSMEATMKVRTFLQHLMLLTVIACSGSQFTKWPASSHIDNGGSATLETNATGHVIRRDGVQVSMIEALSKMLNFSYSFVSIDPRLIPSDYQSAGERGAINYLSNDEADYFLSTMIASPSRFEKADFPAYWAFGSFSTIIPYPKETFNLTASFEPFSYEVWILLVISTFATIVFIKIVLKKKALHQSGIEINNSFSVVPYVLGILISQGQRHLLNRLVVRVAIGAWCCTCFFLVQIYSSTLTSHLTYPNQKPMLNSFSDIADNHRFSLVIDRGYAIDITLQTTESEFLKRFRDTLKKENRLTTCRNTSHCLDHVRDGDAVYSAPTHSLNVLMAADLKRTGTCHYTRTKDTFWNSAVFTLLRKKSPYTESMSRGILRLHETGLLNEWGKWYLPSTAKCMKVNERNGMPRLSMKHLSSAFVILAVGYLLSFSAFVGEKMFGIHRALREVAVEEAATDAKSTRENKSAELLALDAIEDSSRMSITMVDVSEVTEESVYSDILEEDSTAVVSLDPKIN